MRSPRLFASGEPDLREGRIEAFADWLTAPENPLFARVAVNRLWQWHFGEGLLRNPSDFGELGGARRIRNCSTGSPRNWSPGDTVCGRCTGSLVTSEAYRRSSEAGDDGEKTFASIPGIRRCGISGSGAWRRRRFDSIHSAAGDLDLQVGELRLILGTVGRPRRRDAAPTSCAGIPPVAR